MVDEHGNHLLELETAARPVPQTQPEQLRDPKLPPERPWTRRWITWAIPTGLCLAVSAGFGIAAIAENDNARQIANDSSTHFYSDVGDAVHTARVFTVVSAITGAGAVTLTGGATSVLTIASIGAPAAGVASLTENGGQLVIGAANSTATNLVVTGNTAIGQSAGGTATTALTLNGASTSGGTRSRG